MADRGKCLTCEHWLVGKTRITGNDFEQLRQTIGECHCTSGYNPHYLSKDRMAADDGCEFWEKHSGWDPVRMERERKEREERERKERIEKEKKDREAKEAFEKLLKAAERGNANAQFNVGRSYLTGEGVWQNDMKAAEWIEKAAAQGHTEAKDWLAREKAEREAREARNAAEKHRKWLKLFLLSFFLGWCGADRVYVGKIGTGILKAFTFGGLGIWWLIDWIMILLEKFTDKDGNLIRK